MALAVGVAVAWLAGIVGAHLRAAVVCVGAAADPGRRDAAVLAAGVPGAAVVVDAVGADAARTQTPFALGHVVAATQPAGADRAVRVVGAGVGVVAIVASGEQAAVADPPPAVGVIRTAAQATEGDPADFTVGIPIAVGVVLAKVATVVGATGGEEAVVIIGTAALASLTARAVGVAVARHKTAGDADVVSTHPGAAVAAVATLHAASAFADAGAAFRVVIAAAARVATGVADGRRAGGIAAIVGAVVALGAGTVGEALPAGRTIDGGAVVVGSACATADTSTLNAAMGSAAVDVAALAAVQLADLAAPGVGADRAWIGALTIAGTGCALRGGRVADRCIAATAIVVGGIAFSALTRPITLADAALIAGAFGVVLAAAADGRIARADGGGGVSTAAVVAGIARSAASVGLAEGAVGVVGAIGVAAAAFTGDPDAGGGGAVGVAARVVRAVGGVALHAVRADALAQPVGGAVGIVAALDAVAVGAERRVPAAGVIGTAFTRPARAGVGTRHRAGDAARGAGVKIGRLTGEVAAELVAVAAVMIGGIAESAFAQDADILGAGAIDAVLVDTAGLALIRHAVADGGRAAAGLVIVDVAALAAPVLADQRAQAVVIVAAFPAGAPIADRLGGGAAVVGGRIADLAAPGDALIPIARAPGAVGVIAALLAGSTLADGGRAVFGADVAGVIGGGIAFGAGGVHALGCVCVAAVAIVAAVDAGGADAVGAEGGAAGAGRAVAAAAGATGALAGAVLIARHAAGGALLVCGLAGGLAGALAAQLLGSAVAIVATLHAGAAGAERGAAAAFLIGAAAAVAAGAAIGVGAARDAA